VQTGSGCPEFDAEGCYVQCDFGKLSMISVYCPSGSSSDERQQAKFRFREVFLPRLTELQACGREVAICGDWNIVQGDRTEELEVEPEEQWFPAGRTRLADAPAR
jgi:exodeoxyribonuclease III